MSQFLSDLEVTPLADGQNWRVNKDFSYFSLGITITVPAGFITDFASVPKMVRNALPSWNTYGPAAVIHDWMYWSQHTTREAADNILLEAMRGLGVTEAVAGLIHTGVRLGGEPSWNENAELKASGYTRMAGMGSNSPYASL